MPLLPKYTLDKHKYIYRDVRPASVRVAAFWRTPQTYIMVMLGLAAGMLAAPEFYGWADFMALFAWWYAKWKAKEPFNLPLKFPKNAGVPDKHNPAPGKPGAGKAEGILFLGNLDEKGHPDHGKELWLTNNDARTHILFLGTTGSGKTEGLKSLVTNALTWASGFVYVDGKADTDLWVSLYTIARRFGRDDDILVLNYMTANSDDGAVSNTMNPFANGSASYLTNMVVSLMPDAGGDNAMWKERAIALMGALMPAMTWKRDKQGLLLDVSILREYIEMQPIIRLSRDKELPERVIRALKGYLNTLPGYVDAAFNDDGTEKPPSPDQPMPDLSVARQQHGYLSMQFTRSLQSLGDEYAYIFRAQLADVDVLDVVLNRRILVVLIPALEKSGDEAANLGKIIAASLKGMMGSTLGNTVEGSWEEAIETKQTRSNASFMTVFDEVGYYTAQGMAVMAAQARSLGFSLIFAAQDLPSMEKRVKQEAKSILGNCNLKIFGKLEDPTDTQKFFKEHVGSSWVMESKGMTAQPQGVAGLFIHSPFYDDRGAGSAQARDRAKYSDLRKQREGQVHMLFAEYIVKARLFHAVAPKAEALRVHRMLPVPPTNTIVTTRERVAIELASRFKDREWTATEAEPPIEEHSTIADIVMGLTESASTHERERNNGTAGGIAALIGLMRTEERRQATTVRAAPTPTIVASTGITNGAAGRQSARISSDSLIRLPFHEGDEFLVQDVVHGVYNPDTGSNGTSSNGYRTDAGTTPRAISAHSYDGMFTTTPHGRTVTGGSVHNYSAEILTTSLPDEVTTILASVAQRINKRLVVGDEEK